MSRLLHYSQGFEFDPERTYKPDAMHHKPTGMWVSVEGEDDWAEFIKSSWDDRLDDLSCVHEVKLDFDAEILWLQGDKAIRQFHEDYVSNDNDRLPFFDRRIDWTRVKRDYQGIIIAPHNWACRRDLFWYYSWDCASGCIWDMSAIESVTKLRDQDDTQAGEQLKEDA